MASENQFSRARWFVRDRLCILTAEVMETIFNAVMFLWNGNDDYGDRQSLFEQVPRDS